MIATFISILVWMEVTNGQLQGEPSLVGNDLKTIVTMDTEGEITATKTNKDAGCTYFKADIVFVLENNDYGDFGDYGDDANYGAFQNEILDWVKEMLGKTHIGSDGVSVGLFLYYQDVFGTTPARNSTFQLNEHNSAEEIIQAIDNFGNSNSNDNFGKSAPDDTFGNSYYYDNFGNSAPDDNFRYNASYDNNGSDDSFGNTKLPLDVIIKEIREKMFTATHGDRPDAPNIVVLPYSTVAHPGDTLRFEVGEMIKAGIHVYVIIDPLLINSEGQYTNGMVSLNFVCTPPAILNLVVGVDKANETLTIPACQDTPESRGLNCSDVESFDCKNGECVPYQLICDGHSHCTNGYDEEDCDFDVMQSCHINNSMRIKPVRERRVNQHLCFAFATQSGSFGCRKRGGVQLTIGNLEMQKIAMNYLSHLSEVLSITRVELGLQMKTGNQTHADFTWEDGSPLTFTAWKNPFSSSSCVYMTYSENATLSSWITGKCVSNPYVLCAWRTSEMKASIVSQVPGAIKKYSSGSWSSITHFECESGTLISKSHVCDGVSDCLDRSDENECGNVKTFECDDGTLLNIDVWCNFYADCPDQSDELNCVPAVCSIHEWTCDNGQCIPTENLCNDVFDCYDHSDERRTTCSGECEKKDLFSCDQIINSQCISRTLIGDEYNDCVCQGDEGTEVLPDCTKIENGSSVLLNFGKETRGTLNVTCLSSKIAAIVPISVVRNYDADSDITFVHLRYGSEFLIDNVFNGRCHFEAAHELMYISDRKTLDLNWLERNTDNLKKVFPDSNSYVYYILNAPRTLVYRGWLTDDEMKELKIEAISDNRVPHIPFEETLLSSRYATTMRCKTTDVYRYEINKCLLNIKPDGTPFGCRDLTHLDNCEPFDCPENYVKCENSFCLHVSLVCDGQPHCPHGEDEVGCSKHTCKGMYSCKRSSSCLAYSMVCDGIRNCPFGDDELFCGYECPSNCHCAGSAFVCSLRTIQTYSSFAKYVRYLDFSKSEPASHASVDLHEFKHLLFLNMSMCGLTTIVSEKNQSSFEHLNNLRILDVSKNKIKHLQNGAFRGLFNLRELHLDENAELRTIDKETFMDLGNLTYLNMESCGIKYIPNTLFSNLKTLRYLDISNNRLLVHTWSLKDIPVLEHLDVRGTNPPHNKIYFNGIDTLRKIYTDSPIVCCLVNEINKDCDCIAPMRYISSCKHLISNELLRICIKIIGGIALLGNVFVIIYRVKDGCLTNNCKSYVTFVTCLGFSDLLMGIYTIMIASVDVYYRGEYIYHDAIWRGSFMCKFAGILSTISSEASAMLICLIAVDRYVAIRFPFSKISAKTSVILASVSLLLSVFVAILPVMLDDERGEGFYSRSGVCTALPLTNERLHMWQYSVGVFIIFNMVIFVTVGVVQMLLYREVKASSKKSKRKQTNVDVAVAKSLTVVIVTDFFCWFPIGVLGFMSLDGYSIPHEVYAWIIVFVLPINSALNPILYTMSSIRNQKNNAEISRSTKEVASKAGNETLQIHQRINKQRTAAGVSLSRLISENKVTSQMFQTIKARITDDLDFFHHRGFCHGHISEETVFVDWDGNEIIGVWLEFCHRIITENMDELKDKDDFSALIKRIGHHISTRRVENEPHTKIEVDV